LSAGALPQTPQGSLQRSPDTLAGLGWARGGREGGTGRGRREGGKGGEGVPEFPNPELASENQV